MIQRIYTIPVKHDELFVGERDSQVPYHRMYGKEYCVPAVVCYQKKESDLLREAAVEVDRIYWKVLRFIQRHLPDPVLINQLGIHPALIPAARMEVPMHGLSRQDWILHPQGFKMIENNTDTPTGIPETAFLAKSMLTEYTSFENPSEGMDDQIRHSFSTLIECYRSRGFTGNIAFSCYEWHEEDFRNTMYLMEQVKQAGYRPWFAPLEKLEIDPRQGLFCDGKKIDIWYRLYPLEYLVHDSDDDGFPTGEAILNLIENHKLAVINPVQSIITQSKGFMALVWSLFEKNDQLPQLWGTGSKFFDKKECETIRRFLLPTYFDELPFRRSRTPWVSKALLGREGKGTVLYSAEGRQESVEWEHEADREESNATRSYYTEQPRIFQQRVPMEKVNLLTEAGEFEGYLLTGVFIAGGSCAGLLPRIGGAVTGNLAYFAPAAILDEEVRNDRSNGCV